MATIELTVAYPGREGAHSAAVAQLLGELRSRGIRIWDAGADAW